MPWTDAEGLRIGPGDMPENRYPDIGPLLFDELRQEREVIILNEQHRISGVFHFIQDSFGKFLVRLLVLFPVSGAEKGPGVGDMAERP